MFDKRIKEISKGIGRTEMSMVVVRTEDVPDRTELPAGIERIVVRCHHNDSRGGSVIVWADSLSALGYACSVARHVCNAGTRWHIPKSFGGWR